MYGILGEDDSDTDTLKVLIRRLANDPSLSIRPKGFNGCAEMLRKGARQLRAFANTGCTRFVISYDADRCDPTLRHREVIERIVNPSGIGFPCCVLIPVQEIEAWILADIQAVSKVLTSWNPSPLETEPERIDDPKEYLEALSRNNKKKPIYDHATHNAKVAKHLNLDRLRTRCPSFVPLARFICGS